MQIIVILLSWCEIGIHVRHAYAHVGGGQFLTLFRVLCYILLEPCEISIRLASTEQSLTHTHVGPNLYYLEQMSVFFYFYFFCLSIHTLAMFPSKVANLTGN